MEQLLIIATFVYFSYSAVFAMHAISAIENAKIISSKVKKNDSRNRRNCKA